MEVLYRRDARDTYGMVAKLFVNVVITTITNTLRQPRIHYDIHEYITTITTTVDAIKTQKAS